MPKKSTTALESSLEQKVVDESKKRRCLALKLVCVGLYGFPDRTILCPEGRLFFVELKKKGEKANKRQKWFHNLLTKYGFKIFVIDDIDNYITTIEEFLDNG